MEVKEEMGQNENYAIKQTPKGLSLENIFMGTGSLNHGTTLTVISLILGSLSPLNTQKLKMGSAQKDVGRPRRPTIKEPPQTRCLAPSRPADSC